MSPSMNLPKLNQPVYVLIVFLVGLGFAEVNGMKYLFWISLIGSVWFGILVTWSLTLYSWKHNKEK
jgi:hypothetical protein